MKLILIYYVCVPNAANIFYDNNNLIHKNVEMNEVKNYSDEFLSYEKITNMADNNLGQLDKVARQSKNFNCSV